MALAVCCLFTPNALAQDEKKQNLTNEWLLKCPKEGNGTTVQCFVTTTIRWAKNQKLFVMVNVSKPQPDKPPVLQVITPLGVQLSQGLMLKINKNKAVTVAYKACIKQGCVAMINIANELLETLENKAEMTVRFGLAGKKVANTTLDFAGFKQAYDSMIKSNAKMTAPKKEG